MIRFCSSLLLALAMIPCMAPQKACAQEEEPRTVILSDTEAYCQDLGRMVSMHPRRGPEVERLAAQGREMCDRGEIRGGILRLRQAVRILNHGYRHEPPQ